MRQKPNFETETNRIENDLEGMATEIIKIDEIIFDQPENRERILPHLDRIDRRTRRIRSLVSPKR